MTKLTLAVIFGGYSSEYNVSLQSASAVIKAIDKSKYDVVMLGIDTSGEWFRFAGDVDRITADTWRDDSCCKNAFITPCRNLHGVVEFDGNAACFTRIDVAFPVLHGKNGEDGTIQGLLELAGIPIVGCKMLSSALCMDKDKAHKLVELAGIRVPRSLMLENEMYVGAALTQADGLGYPLFVKPVKAGSSFGITKVLNKNELPAAFNLAFEYDDRVLIEESIPGFEVSCAVLGNDELIVGEPGVTLEEYLFWLKEFPYGNKPFRYTFDDSDFKIFYLAAGKGTAMFEIEDNFLYSVSGDNMGGFIVT